MPHALPMAHIGATVLSSCVIKRTPFQIQRAVILALIMRELKTRFGQHWTGLVWLFGEPLLKLTVSALIFTFIRGLDVRGGYPFIVYLLVAMLPFSLFSSLWTSLMNGISANSGLYGYKQVKPIDALFARTVLEFMLQVFIFIFAFLFLGYLGFSFLFPDDFLMYMGVVFLFVSFGFSFGLVSAILTHFLPKSRLAISLISMPLQILSGTIFPVTHFPQDIIYWLLFNPLLHLVELARAAFFPGYIVIGGVTLFYPFAFMLTVLSLGMCMYWIWRVRLATSR